MQTGNRHTLRKVVIDQFRRNAEETDPKKVRQTLCHSQSSSLPLIEAQNHGRQDRSTHVKDEID